MFGVFELDNKELVSTGRPLAGVEVEIRGDDSRPLPEDQVGRIFVRGPSVMAGYFGRADLTGQVLHDGWLDCGDLGFVHDGELFVCGRSKETVIIRGANHAPQDFEAALDGLAGVRAGCAVAVGYLPVDADDEALAMLVETTADAPDDLAVDVAARVLAAHRHRRRTRRAVGAGHVAADVQRKTAPARGAYPVAGGNAVAVLAGVARLATRAPRRMIAVAVLVLVGTAAFGIPVAGRLSAGGLTDPGAQSSQARTLLARTFGQGDMPLLITVSSPAGANSSAARTVGTEIVQTLTGSPNVATVTSPWTAPPSAAASLISKDGTIGVIVAGITGGDNGAPKNAGVLINKVVHDRDGVTVRAGGEAAMMLQITQQSENDLKIMEGVAIPLSFLVLVWVFGGLVAASLPLAVGAVAIFGAMAVLHVVTFATDVSIFALNLAVALGLALAIDYTLLLLSRFRDELASGAERDDALMRTMVSAGRTVLFSAMTVALSMSAMVLFPIYALKSFGYAGVAVVAFASLAAVFVTPAAIVLLGDRLDSLDLRRWLRRPVAVVRPVEESPWYRLAMFSMRRAVPVAVAIVALLVALGAPFLGVKWGVPDDRVLPTSSSSHVVGDQLRTQFSADLAKNLTIVIPDVNGVSSGTARRLRCRAVAGVRRVVGLVARRHLRRRCLRGSSDGSDGDHERQRVPHRHQHRTAVFTGIGVAARYAASRSHPGGPAGADRWDTPGQPGHRQRHRIPAGCWFWRSSPASPSCCCS